MSIRAGLVGLPNVGKSTLFNALTKSSVPAENYPFCTIDPHLALTNVPDDRLEKLFKIYNSSKIIPTTLSFVDIAGLVKGAASGEGLGNQFLSHIGQVDLILHVVRVFENPDIISNKDEIDPLGDYEIIICELMLKDLESVQKRITKVQHLSKSARSNPATLKELEAELELLTILEKTLDKGNIQEIRNLMAQHKDIATIPLLCAKNYLIIANCSEAEIDQEGSARNKHLQALINHFGSDKVIPICVRVEAELAQLNDSDAMEMMSLLGLQERGLDTIIKKSYQQLDLITFFTCGPQEIHAWTITKGTTIRKAAGEIHSDIERGFIAAEVFNYADLAQYGDVASVKAKGKMRIEGQDYLVKDGDIIHVRFNV